MRAPVRITHRAGSGRDGDAEPVTESRRRRFNRRFKAVHPWIATAAAAGALWFGWLNWQESRESPELRVDLPSVLRIGQERGAMVFIQPTLTSPKEADEVEVVTSARLEAAYAGPPGTGREYRARPSFYWVENVFWKFSEEGSFDHWWNSDPGPLVIKQDEPQQKTMYFYARNWRFAPGRYDLTLTLHRGSEQKPLSRRFCVTFRASDLVAMSQAATTDNTSYYRFRNDVPGVGAEGCHFLY
ncbi:hypothetical protein EES41_11740 [Streptomyces sp. ADI95-16]|nr:hypothetical protein EES41_11740 [Streptomyces sp. ADI95-16]